MGLTPQEAELRRERIRQIAYGQPVPPPRPKPPEPKRTGHLNLMLDLYETLLLTDASGKVIAELTALPKSGRRARLAVRGDGITFARVPAGTDQTDATPARNAG